MATDSSVGTHQCSQKPSISWIRVNPAFPLHVVTMVMDPGFWGGGTVSMAQAIRTLYLEAQDMETGLPWWCSG